MCAGMAWPQVRAGIAPTHDSCLQQLKQVAAADSGNLYVYQQHKGVQR